MTPVWLARRPGGPRVTRLVHGSGLAARQDKVDHLSSGERCNTSDPNHRDAETCSELVLGDLAG